MAWTKRVFAAKEHEQLGVAVKNRISVQRGEHIDMIAPMAPATCVFPAVDIFFAGFICKS